MARAAGAVVLVREQAFAWAGLGVLQGTTGRGEKERANVDDMDGRL